MNVNTGTVLRNAHENVADVYSSPSRNMHWVSVTLEGIDKILKPCIYILIIMTTTSAHN